MTPLKITIDNRNYSNWSIFNATTLELISVNIECNLTLSLFRSSKRIMQQIIIIIINFEINYQKEFEIVTVKKNCRDYSA